MASEPTVCCIMLTKDRPELAARAVRCFRAQTYQNKIMLIVDSGHHERFEGMPPDDVGFLNQRGDIRCCLNHRNDRPIGALRNTAASLASSQLNADIIAHWDDDDYSHPNRIAEQVAFLQSSGAAVVGYNQMLFFREFRATIPAYEAWLYTGPAHQPLGTSLCYWRSTWESHRFDDRKHAGEDTDFLHRVGHRRVKSVTSICSCREFVSVSYTPYSTLVDRLNAANATDLSPRMVACVHGANTQQKTYDGFFKGGTVEMRRVAEWDDKVRKVLEGA